MLLNPKTKKVSKDLDLFQEVKMEIFVFWKNKKVHLLYNCKNFSK